MKTTIETEDGQRKNLVGLSEIKQTPGRGVAVGRPDDPGNSPEDPGPPEGVRAMRGTQNIDYRGGKIVRVQNASKVRFRNNGDKILKENVKEATMVAGEHVRIEYEESGVIYTAFVNAQSGDVTLLEGTDPIYAFLSEEEVQEVKQRNNQTSTDSGVTVTVIVTNEDGEITGTTNVTVPQGGSVNIEVQNNATATNNSTATASG